MFKECNLFLSILSSSWGFCLWSYPVNTVFNSMPSYISSLLFDSMLDDISWQLETTMMTVSYHWQALNIRAFLPSTESAFANISCTGQPPVTGGNRTKRIKCASFQPSAGQLQVMHVERLRAWRELGEKPLTCERIVGFLCPVCYVGGALSCDFAAGSLS